MTREELLALAERVEALTGADRGVDLEVILASGTHVLERRGRDKKAWLYEAASDFRRLDPSPYSYGVFGLPRFTTSLDAAMSLVPEGWGGAVHFSENRQHHTVKLGRSYPTNAQAFGEAATPALALTAAALRALAEQQP